MYPLVEHHWYTSTLNIQEIFTLPVTAEHIMVCPTHPKHNAPHYLQGGVGIFRSLVLWFLLP